MSDPARVASAAPHLVPALKHLVPALALGLAGLLWSGDARADFRLCNNTASRVGVAIGYRDKDGWLTEGWWNVNTHSCETILNGVLAARYYYVYAIDYDQGGEWSGRSVLCTREKEFTIRGFQDCLARGYDRTGFFEIDTGEQKSWTVQLSEQAGAGARPQSSAPSANPAPASPTSTNPAPASPAPAGSTPAPAASSTPGVTEQTSPTPGGSSATGSPSGPSPKSP